jgi:hypothetical protein
LTDYYWGDFNSRTATDDDFILIDDDDPSTEGIDIVNSVCFLDMHSLPCKRNSRDKTRNNFGKLLLDFCKSNDLFILNGRLNENVTKLISVRKKSYTFSKYVMPSILKYIIHISYIFSFLL